MFINNDYSLGGNLGSTELLIDQLTVELAETLDTEYEVKNEFYGVLVNAINRHIELIGEA